MALNQRKVAMVGCGSSGAASCFALMQSGLFTEMVLIDSLPKRLRVRLWIFHRVLHLQDL